MLTVSKTGASHAAHYYTADTPGQKRADSAWIGKAAVELGLTGQVNPDDFESTINGFSPSGEPLFQRRLISRTDGIDLTFSAPKSVSLLAVWKGSVEILNAHRQAVRETFEKIEQEAQTRIMTGKKVAFHTSKNLVAAMFEHTLNRHNDPQLHTHVVVINTTRYRKRWRSFYARRVFQKIKEWGQYYRDRLAQILQRMGHKLRDRGDGLWEVAAIPVDAIESFSRRRAEIIAIAGPDASSARKQYACLTTRPPKNVQPIERLRERWDREYRQLESKSLKRQLIQELRDRWYQTYSL